MIITNMNNIETPPASDAGIGLENERHFSGIQFFPLKKSGQMSLVSYHVTNVQKRNSFVVLV